MLETYPDARWQQAGLAQPLLAFACLPSLSLHPSRLPGLLPDAARKVLEQLPAQSQAWSGLHKRWSAALSHSMGLPVLKDLNEPALRLALLPRDGWQRLQHMGGAVLAGPRIRACIRRDDVTQLRADLGAESYAFALGSARQAHGGMNASLALQTQEVLPYVARWGAALLGRAFLAASAAVASRAYLRLPEAALDDAAHPDWADLSPAAALALCLSLTQELDPTWHSSFPATR